MKILIVDNDALFRSALSTFIETALGHSTIQCASTEEALNLLKDDQFPLVITGNQILGMDSLRLLQEIKSLPYGDSIGVILITAFPKVESAVMALREGAFDYFSKPVEVKQLAGAIARFCQRKKDEETKRKLKENGWIPEKTEYERTLSDFKLKHNIYADIEGIGRIGIFSDAMKAAVVLALRFHEDRNIPVLIEGETGTGKEVIARLVHQGNSRENRPFVSVNCSAISPSLYESELFGYEGGAFTGSKSRGAMGKMESSKGGTLFLDEIADMPLEMQPKLLRALQEKEIYRVGGSKRIKLDIRIIVATNRNLRQCMEQGHFRKDLFFRLNLGRIYIPTLREQKESIVPLSQMFLSIFAEQKKRRFRFIHRDAMKILEDYPWPGNIRELRNTIERVIILNDEEELRGEHLDFLTLDGREQQVEHGTMIKPGQIALPPSGLNLPDLELEIIRKTLYKFNNNKTKAAEYLGISRHAIRTRLQRGR